MIKQQPQKETTLKSQSTQSIVVGTMHPFALTAPKAKEVKLVGDFTQWQEKPIRMHKDTNGTWGITIPLAPGVHRYRFLVDGQWQDDPKCVLHTPNPYGSQDAVCQVA